jgi:hypothetical protein
VGTWNGATFDPVTTTMVRLSMIRTGTLNNGIGISEWEVFGVVGAAASAPKSDKAKLLEAILAFEGLNEADYDADLYSSALPPYNAAKTVLISSQGALTGAEAQAETDLAAKNLILALDKLTGREPFIELIANADKIVTAAFTDASADAFKAALAAAKKEAANAISAQEDTEKASADLIAAIEGLVLKDSLTSAVELVDLLVYIATLEKADYNPAAWNNLMLVVDEAWDLLVTMFSLQPDGSLSPLATVDPLILEATRRLKEALAILLNTGSPDDPKDHEFGEEMDTGVRVRGGVPVFDLDIEDYLKPEFGARYAISAKDINEMSYVHLTFSFSDDDYDVKYNLSDFLVDSGFVIDAAYTKDEVDVVEGIRYVSLYLRHNSADGTATSANAEEDLLYVYLLPKPATKPVSKPSTVGLGHLDITYFDGTVIDADVKIINSVAGAWVNYYSKYDINRDGKVTLADVDIVRRNLGKNTASPDWNTTLVQRCNLVAPFTSIGLLDLQEIIAAYEDNLP